MPDLDNHEEGAIALTLVSFVSSIVSFIIGYITQTNIAWTVGIIAGCVSIIAGISTIRKNNISRRKTIMEIKIMERISKN